ncbi:MAG TPA: hypothetical protein VHQ46_00350 [Desulfobacteria bacterium]|nr:hypothetical protein [Desulfobacteria bacterium]
MNLETNDKQLIKDFKSQGENFSIGIRDIAGISFVIGILLSIAAYQLNWIENVVTGAIALIFLVFTIIFLIAYPLADIFDRNGVSAGHLWGKYHVGK